MHLENDVAMREVQKITKGFSGLFTKFTCIKRNSKHAIVYNLCTLTNPA